jgi:Fe-S cluster biogenesis protein NfuA
MRAFSPKRRIISEAAGAVKRGPRLYWQVVDEIKITGEPSRDGDRCAFAYFSTAARLEDSALASELLTLPGVSSVLIADDTVTVGAENPIDWPSLGIGNVIRKHLRAGGPIVSADYFRDLPAEGDLKWVIRDLLERQINPAVAQHGGFVELIDVRRNDVYLRLGGGCQGCGAADVTLKQGIEKAIRELAPLVGEILDTTDHAAGRNPFYAPSK